MKTWLKAHAGKALFLPPILIAAAVLVIAIQAREVAERTPPRETATAVRVVVAPSVAVVPRVLGYGNVQPETVWEAVAEVDGRIVEVHPQLKKGAILPAGAVLLRRAVKHCAALPRSCAVLCSAVLCAVLLCRDGVLLFCRRHAGALRRRAVKCLCHCHAML